MKRPKDSTWVRLLRYFFIEIRNSILQSFHNLENVLTLKFELIGQEQDICFSLHRTVLQQYDSKMDFPLTQAM